MKSCVSVRRKEAKSGRIMNEKNDWGHNVEGDAVEGPSVCVNREEVLQALPDLTLWCLSLLYLLPHYPTAVTKGYSCTYCSFASIKLQTLHYSLG